MRDILLVSCFNELTNTIYDMLSQDNKVQLCPADSEMLQKTIEISKPELIVVLLNGLDESANPMFISLNNAYKHIPVLCCGNDDEQNIFQPHINPEQFNVIATPDNRDTLYDAVNKTLSGEFSNNDAASSLPESDDSVPDNNSVSQTSSQNNPDKKAILLVDDDPLLLRTVRSLLHDKYKILMATSGAEALVVLGRQSPDLIILDYNMPVCDGRQTLKMIRELDSAKDIPVVFLTSIGDKPHIEMALKLNPAGYLLKPVKEEMLFEIIEQIL